jgi:hypothetical protein
MANSNLTDATSTSAVTVCRNKHHSNSSECDVTSNHEYDSNNEPTSTSLEVEMNGHSEQESKVVLKRQYHEIFYYQFCSTNTPIFFVKDYVGTVSIPRNIMKIAEFLLM